MINRLRHVPVVFKKQLVRRIRILLIGTNNNLYRKLLVISNVCAVFHLFKVCVDCALLFARQFLRLTFVQHSLYTSFDEANLEFTASLLERYITSGAIGFAALVYFFVKQFGVQKMLVQKAILILIVVAFAYSAIEYTYWFAFFFVLCMSFGFEDETQMEVKRHE